MRAFFFGQTQTYLRLTSIGFLVIVSLGGCASHPTVSPNLTSEIGQPGAGAKPALTAKGQPQPVEIPAWMKTVAEAGEDAYDDAKSKDWKRLQTPLSTLQKAEPDLKTSPVLMRESLKLKQAAQNKSQLPAMQAANQITLAAINLTRDYPQPIPVEIALLDYDGRDLEIGAMEKNQPRIQKTVHTLENHWQAVKASVQSHHGEKEATQFDQLMVQLKAAQDYKTYSHLATSILDRVDQLETVFTPK